MNGIFSPCFCDEIFPHWLPSAWHLDASAESLGKNAQHARGLLECPLRYFNANPEAAEQASQRQTIAPHRASPP